MTKDELRILKKLISFKERDFTIDTPDNEVLKSIMYNMALKEVVQLLIDYQNGNIPEDVINSL